MTDEQDLQALLLRGIELARTGKKTEARALFEQVIRADQYNEQAWMWMAAVARSTAERREALEIVLEINADNRQAREALNRLGGPRARRKADAAQAIADRIGSDDEINEAQFQPVAAPEPEPEVAPEPELTPEQKEAALARELIETARAEREAEAAASDADSAPDDETGPAVEVIDVEKARQQRLYSLFTALVLVLVAVLAGVLLFQNIQPVFTPAPTPTDLFATKLARLNTATPTYDNAIIVTSQPGLYSNIPATWTPSPSPTITISPTVSPTPLPPERYTLLFSRRARQETAFALYSVQGDGAAADELLAAANDVREPALGVDGRRVLVVAEIEGKSQIALLPLGEPAPTATPLPATAAAAEDLTPEAADSTLDDQAAAGAQPEAGSLTALTQITASAVSAPSWSSDGYRFVFSANIDGDEDIYASDIDGSSFVRLTQYSGADRDPVWSPDGQWIVFASDRDGTGQTELYRMRPDGTEIAALTNSQGSSFSPDWSPDGRQIVFVSDRDRDADLYVMNADGTNESLLTRNDDDAEDRDPAWSPDGRWIAFSSNRASDNYRLFLLDPFVGTVLPVTTGTADDLAAAWLPVSP